VARPALSAEAAAARRRVRWRILFTRCAKVCAAFRRTAIEVCRIPWALFLGAMLTQQVITAPLSDRILHGGAVGTAG